VTRVITELKLGVRQEWPWLVAAVFLVCCFALAAGGCDGKTGPMGPSGTDGQDGECSCENPAPSCPEPTPPAPKPSPKPSPEPTPPGPCGTTTVTTYETDPWGECSPAGGGVCERRRGVVEIRTTTDDCTGEIIKVRRAYSTEAEACSCEVEPDQGICHVSNNGTPSNLVNLQVSYKRAGEDHEAHLDCESFYPPDFRSSREECTVENARLAASLCR
jgi:hypothetical protein